MKKLFKQIISDFHENEIRIVKKRSLEIDLNSWKIISIIWPRRSWKSSYLFSVMKNLLDNWIAKQKILYINFEDERINILWKELSIILDSYRELYPESNLNEVYFFFDEIQNINWRENFIRRLFDDISKHIFITWSNSKLLSTEIATALRGRSVAYELLPLSFSEFLAFNWFDWNEYSSKWKAQLLILQNEYMKWWWFPELIWLNEDTKIKIIQEYFDVMLYNDIIERYKIKDSTLLKQFIKLILQSTTKEFSVNKIADTLKSQWFKFDKNILYTFLDHLNTVYFFYPISKRDKSFKKQSLKKIYTFDTGYLTAMNFSFSSDDWKRLENTLFQHLYRQYKDNIFFLKNWSETDFVIPMGNKTLIYQSCFELTEDNKSREIQWCIDAMKKFNTNFAFIITAEQEDKIEINWQNIKIEPFYRICRNI